LKKFEKYFLDNLGPASLIVWYYNRVFSFREPSLGAPVALEWLVSPTEEVLRGLNLRLSRYGASIRRAEKQVSDTLVLEMPYSPFAIAAIERALPTDVVRIAPKEPCEAALAVPSATTDASP